MTFFRTTQAEADSLPDLKRMASLEGIPLYVHETLVGYFEAQPLVLTSRGPRLAIERDQALEGLEASLRRAIESGYHGK